MDPKATLKSFVTAVEDDDYEAAKEHAMDLRKWLHNRGYIPAVDSATLDFLMFSLLDYWNKSR